MLSVLLNETIEGLVMSCNNMLLLIGIQTETLLHAPIDFIIFRVVNQMTRRSTTRCSSRITTDRSALTLCVQNVT